MLQNQFLRREVVMQRIGACERRERHQKFDTQNDPVREQQKALRSRTRK